ncbi:ABC transporter substrate-binding protein [Kitasatospora sp. NBC_01287]|uniref:ABC transporter substrate-binding protein n=1 Tax=Kitasatospora sp. NBC_01287 TaxID=2903573 RepID=UPI0022551A84|nr:ABC transporter substrate-binding protein [Kitasatospora sp. NBC_01287]MCX4744182.1 ABC transporter substrate-binding protein [Kitasatospora sp. NBC_01287]
MNLPGTRPRRSALLTAGALAGSLLLLTACSSSGGGGSDSPDGGKTTLTVGDFGTFGYKEAGLFDAYMAAHPDITIKEDTTTAEADYWTALQTHLSAGGGLDDVQALEVGRIALATSDALSGDFADLGKAPGVDKSAYLPWKWQQATTADGRTIGLGTDVGPMAICYRQDLFQAAGLPSDPAAVSALWAGDWSKYVAVGAEFQAKAPKGTYFMDTATGLFNAVVSSAGTQYYQGGKLAYKDSPSVKSGWELAMRADAAGLSQGLKEFDTPWQTAFARSSFATTVCPSWQQANIQKFSGPANSGKWNIAQAPAAGNWGGSFLAVPASGKHTAAAEALVAWLTAPEQQAKVFQAVGNIPSNQGAYALPAVTGFKNPYIGPDAATGQIFSAAAKAIQPAEIGPHSGDLQNDFSNGILLVEQNHKSAADAWSTTVQQIDSSVQ